jgi:probable addiction module antidote protein
MQKRTKLEDYLDDRLQDPEEAIEYLSAAFETNDADAILIAVGDVVRARGGMKAVADKAKLNRQNLYKMLNQGGGATLRNFMSVIDAIGLRLAPEWKKKRKAG